MIRNQKKKNPTGAFVDAEDVTQTFVVGAQLVAQSPDVRSVDVERPDGRHDLAGDGIRRNGRGVGRGGEVGRVVVEVQDWFLNIN